MLIVGVIPVLLIIMIALHLYVKSSKVRIGIIAVGLVGCVYTGYMHFILIGVLLLCIELIINKLTGK